MLRHCSTATATEYPILSLRQDVAFVMIMEHEEDTEIHDQPLNGMNFDFVQLKEKVLLSLCCS